MLFNSLPFLYLFLPITLVGFYALARQAPRMAWGWITLCSLAFYSYWHLAFLPVILMSIAGNYAIARLILANETRPRLQTAILAAGITCDLAALCYYKYLFAIFGFLRAHSGFDLPFGNVLLPLGISFFTFTQIGYLVDIKQGVTKDKRFLNYVLFVTFFPHLIAGPILHNREMMPQFADPQNQRFAAENFAAGIAMFVIGLAKKVLIADRLSLGIVSGFNQAADLSPAAAWLVAITYTFQLYFDFSGYTDMAIGLARLFNIRFPMNFNSPFKATSIIDYWQRWHMTLTRFTNMYLFTPLSLALTRRWLRRRPGTIKAASSRPSGFAVLIAFPLLFTMTILGVWHGAGLQFLVFGVLNGSYLVVNHAARSLLPKARNQARPLLVQAASHAGKVLLTCLAVLIAQVFFRAESVGQALQLLRSMAGLQPNAAIASPMGLDTSYRGWVEVIFLYGVVWLAPNSQQLLERYQPVLGRFDSLNKLLIVRLVGKVAGAPRGAALARAMEWRPNLLTGALAFGGFALTLAFATGVSPFLYFQF